MRKRLISILTTITMLSALIPMVIPSSTASAQGVATNMKLGDYVQMGSYYNEPILWRVVGFQKVDKNGNVIAWNNGKRQSATSAIIGTLEWYVS